MNNPPSLFEQRQTGPQQWMRACNFSSGPDEDRTKEAFQSVTGENGFPVRAQSISSEPLPIRNETKRNETKKIEFQGVFVVLPFPSGRLCWNGSSSWHRRGGGGGNSCGPANERISNSIVSFWLGEWTGLNCSGLDWTIADETDFYSFIQPQKWWWCWCSAAIWCGTFCSLVCCNGFLVRGRLSGEDPDPLSQSFRISSHLTSPLLCPCFLPAFVPTLLPFHSMPFHGLRTLAQRAAASFAIGGIARSLFVRLFVSRTGAAKIPKSLCSAGTVRYGTAATLSRRQLAVDGSCKPMRKIRALEFFALLDVPYGSM